MSRCPSNGSGVFIGITGTYKPSCEVKYNQGSLGTVVIEGQSLTGASFEPSVDVRVKLDAGSGPFTVKIAAVETMQKVCINVVPMAKDGRWVLCGHVTLVSVTATKERQAKTREAEKLCDTVKSKLELELNCCFDSIRPLQC